MARKTNTVRIEELEKQIIQIQDDLKKLADTDSSSKLELQNQILELKSKITEKEEKEKNYSLAKLGILISTIGALGFFGLKLTLPKQVAKNISKEATTELNEILKIANEKLIEIEQIEKKLKSPLIIVQTDYDDNKSKIGALCGKIYEFNNNARIQLLPNTIDKFDISHAALTLWKTSRNYPEGSVFLAITTPGGIKSDSRYVVVETLNNLLFVGNDNGTFDLVVKKFGHKNTYVISSKEIVPPKLQDKFTGEDILGPTAARIANGYELKNLGPIDSIYEFKLQQYNSEILEGKIQTSILDFDNFGNTILNVNPHELKEINVLKGDDLTILINHKKYYFPYLNSFGDVEEGKRVAIMNDNFLTLAINLGSFQKELRVKRQEKVIIEKAANNR